MKFYSIASLVALAASFVAAAPVAEQEEVTAVLGYKRTPEDSVLGYKRDPAIEIVSTKEDKRDAPVEVASIKKDKRHCATPLKN